MVAQVADHMSVSDALLALGMLARRPDLQKAEVSQPNLRRQWFEYSNKLVGETDWPILIYYKY